MSTVPHIPEWFNGKNVFITGVTGFLGKVLLEKLIRSTPNINRVYVLLRSKRGKSLQERVADLKEFGIFSIVNERYPNWLSKVVPVEGDCVDLKLGLSQDNWNMLKDNVNVIFHVAASIRFDDPLHKAILLNVRGTREVCQLALEAKKLDVFVHVSTAYCNNHYKVVDEKLYPPLGDWRQDIKLATEVDEQSFNIVTKHFTYFQANTYTYTKSIAEHLVNDMCNGKVPTVIARPSIVIPTCSDPFVGWMDNFNNIIGMMIAVAKGVKKVDLGGYDTLMDYVPVDNVAKVLIAAACSAAKDSKIKELAVLNVSGDPWYITPISEYKAICFSLMKTTSFKNQLWYPTVIVTACDLLYNVLFVILQLLPAMIIDGILLLSRKKPFLVNLQRKLYVGNMVLKYFTINEWQFINKKMLQLMDNLHPLDKSDFELAKKRIDIAKMKLMIDGCKKYLLKEPLNDDTYVNKMYYVHTATVYAFYALLIWYLIKLIPIIFT